MRPIETESFGKSFIFFQPVKHNGWSMAIVCSGKSFFKAANRMGLIVMAIILFMLLLLTTILRHAVRQLTRPLELFTQAVDEVAHGNLQAELPEVHSKDEMLHLHKSFSTMQKSLAKQMDELKTINEQKGRIEGELHIASAIQMGMLPKTFPTYPDRDDVQLFGSVTPAKEVGGDLFDFFIRNEKLFFCIGDVSGKGVPASLVMAVTRSLFRSVSAHESMPDHIVTLINESMADMNETNMFVTLFVGVLDLPTGRLRYCNAGHDAPLLVGQGVGMLPVESNIPVAVMPGWKFVQQEVKLFTDTTIFLFTDGLTEAENADHAQFRMERVVQVTKDSLADKEQAPKQLIKRMSDAVHQFVGDAEQSDDLTMLAIQYIKQQRDIKLRKTIVLPNDTKEVPRLATFVDEVCEELGFDSTTTMQMNLAIEEAVVNVMNYAYAPGTKGEVNVEASSNDLRLKFTITDSGSPFDPTLMANADTTLSAEERPIGGLGIHLVRQIMDSINYERIDGLNVLTLRKKLKKQ
jgi:sigma-B regulation protein RsbU (phosphoserine phosphatase)